MNKSEKVDGKFPETVYSYLVSSAFSSLTQVLLGNSATLSILMQRQLWNWIDAAIILTWLFSVASGNASLPVDPTLLRVARLARLLRTFDCKKSCLHQLNRLLFTQLFSLQGLLKVLHTFRSLRLKFTENLLPFHFVS